MLMRVAALAVVPRVIRALSRNHQAEARLPAPAEVEQPLEKPEPVVASPAKLQKTPARRWTITRAVKTKSPWLCAWWSPTGTRGPPSHFGGSRSWAYLHRRSFPIGWVDPSGLDRIEYFTLFETGITHGGDSVTFHWDLRLSTTGGGGSPSGAGIIHTLFVPTQGGWKKLGEPIRQESGPMSDRQVLPITLQIRPWDCDRIPKSLAIKVVTELDGGKKTYSKESEYTIELGKDYKAYRVPNNRSVKEIWQDSWRIERNSRN